MKTTQERRDVLLGAMKIYLDNLQRGIINTEIESLIKVIKEKPIIYTKFYQETIKQPPVVKLQSEFVLQKCKLYISWIMHYIQLQMYEYGEPQQFPSHLDPVSLYQYLAAHPNQFVFNQSMQCINQLKLALNSGDIQALSAIVTNGTLDSAHLIQSIPRVLQQAITMSFVESVQSLLDIYEIHNIFQQSLAQDIFEFIIRTTQEKQNHFKLKLSQMVPQNKSKESWKAKLIEMGINPVFISLERSENGQVHLFGQISNQFVSSLNQISSIRNFFSFEFQKALIKQVNKAKDHGDVIQYNSNELIWAITGLIMENYEYATRIYAAAQVFKALNPDMQAFFIAVDYILEHIFMI
ncbi:Conserved_hypothetical protein [Hexamita inflata]|uniref:Uncharacterized protein n=1 Tax=Hexamita inflata TaxID=28002 RepID=A0AA86NMS0_9EUKA|nr:Conserved hypothetical protein [Hexamita inflata]